MPLLTQTDRSIAGRLLRSPLVLALLVTAANAAKPVVVDDTAYLTYARHIADHPLDPYGFVIHWYTFPEPAFEVLAPPVVPYWLAAGLRIFGERIVLLKLWLLPFVWLFAWCLNALLRRFARDTSLLPLIVLSPAVLPTVNLMLDIPALALGLAAVVMFAWAVDRASWRCAIGAGLLAALAMQTKYTMLLIPPVVGWYGLLHGRIRLATVAIIVALLAFAGWEGLLAAKYDRSHFLFHASAQQAELKPSESQLAVLVAEKINLVPGLLGDFGCLGVGVGLVAAGALPISRRWLVPTAGLWLVGFGLVAFASHRWSAPIVPLYWQGFGGLFLAAIAGCAVTLLVRIRNGLGIRNHANSLFLVGWFAIELAGYFALTPFPAARRVIGLVVVGGILAARAASRNGRRRPERRATGWTIALGVAAGAIVTGIDTLDAFPEKYCAERAQALTSNRPAGGAVWFAGHWGFQYYCERAGMRSLVPGETVLAPGDLLVLPIHPDPHGFDRPHIGQILIQPPASVATPIAEVIWDDWLSARTIPNFYGGNNPVEGRDRPRLRVVVYRVLATWKPDGLQRR